MGRKKKKTMGDEAGGVISSDTVLNEIPLVNIKKIKLFCYFGKNKPNDVFEVDVEKNINIYSIVKNGFAIFV